MAKKDYYSMTKNRRIKDKEEKDITSPSSSEKKDYYGLVSKKRMENNINLDTLGSDIESANSSLQSVYEGWQEQNVLQNTKSSVSSIQDRVKLYKDYVNQYGGVDDVETFNAEIDKTYNSYKDVLDSLESLEQEYGRYKDSGSYSNAQKKAQMVKDFSGLSYDDVQAKLKEYDKDSDEYKFLSEYGVNVGYGDLRDYDKELESIGMSRDAVKEAQNTIAGSPLSKSFDGSSVTANEYGERLAENARKYALDHAFDSYKDIQNAEGFEESSKYKEAEYDGLMDRLFNEGKDAYEYVNFVHSQPSELVGMPSDKYGWNAGIGKMPAGIENMTKEEVAVFNAIADEKGYDEAFKFLKDMEVTLSKRGADKNSASTAEWLEDGNAVTRKLKQGAMTVLSVPTGLVGGVEGALDDVSNVFSGDEINPYNSSHSMMNFANTVQSTTSENIGEYTEENEWVGTDLPLVGNAWSFGYDTGLSIAESAIGISTFGSGFTPIMGMDAASNKAKELKEAGATETEVVIGATASGVAEAFFEKYSIEGLLGSETPDTIRKAAKNFVKQSLTEASEEMVTEFSNAIVDLVNRQNTSDIMKSYNDYLERGYSEEEAFNQVHRDVAEDIIVAGIGGAISGGVLGGTYNSVNYHNLDSQGKQIRANERAQDMMALSEMTPKESETYKLYNEYAQKGVNADNIKNAQLGNLYTTATSEGVKTSIATTPKTAEEKSREQRAMSLHTGEETKVADTGNSVKIKGIKTDGDETILLTSDGEVSANNIALSKSDAELVSFAESMGEEKGNLLLSQYDGTANVKAYVNSFEMAYSYGETGFGADSVLKNRGVLTEAQAAEIYKAGMMNKVNVQQKAIAEINAKHSKEMTVKGVLDDSIIDYDNATTDGSKVAWKSLTSTQREAITFAKGFAEATGVNIKFVKSDIVNGKHVGKNGSYNPESNTIEIDVYAGRIDVNSTKDAIIPTISHEVTHWMKAKSPAMYNQMREYVMNTLSNGKYTAEQLVGAEIDRIKKNHPDAEVSEDMAIDELIARACEDMLSNSNAARKMLNQLSTKDKSSFVEKVKKTFKNLMDWVNELLSKYKSGSNEAKFLREYQGKLKELSKMWDEALVEAVRTNQSLQKEGITGEQAINAVMEKVGITVDLGTESASPATQFSERTWTESEYVQNREKAVAQLSKALGVSKKKAGQYIDDINSIARLIAVDRARLDYDPNLDEHATVVKPNSEYKYSVDMSTLCAKRLLFTGTFDAIQRMLPNTAMDSDDIVKIRAMMKDAGHEVACGICYVESTRREIGTITADFIERYKEAQRTGKPISRINSAGKEVALKEKGTGENFYVEEGYTPNLAELNTTDIDLVKRDHPSVYAAYLAYMNARGQAKPKLLETRAEYKGEILKHFKAKSAVQSRNAAGGLRLQSFSDFEIPHLIDMMQIITDMSSVGLMSQAYTKVPNFAEAFGDTGVKINLSLIAKDSGLDAEGNLIFDDVEGINHEDAFRLRDKYSKNVGTILVGKNDAHIIAAMADPRIDYIIPFHKSSWKESLYDALGLTGYDDYTETQNEKPIDKSRKISNFAPSEYWDYSKSGEENAQLYLEKCKADGRIPKFPQFQSYEGYWKLLIDFKMYDNDGVGSPQMPVTPNFNMDESRRMLEEYKGGHRNFPVAKDVVDEFVKDYKKNKPKEQYSDRESDIDSWLDGLSLDDLMDILAFDDLDIGKNDKRTDGAKKNEKAKRRVDEVNKKLKQIGLSFNGTKSLAWSDERIDKYLGGGYYGSSNPIYAQAYIAYITPQQFLNLTVGGKVTTLDRIQSESESYGNVDFEKLGSSTPMFLEIKEEKNGAKVVGHEGRHRMYLLGKAGFEKVPVLLFDYRTKYDKTAKNEMKLIAQKFNDTDLVSKTRNTTINDVIPFSQGNRNAIVEKFGTGNTTADIRYSDREVRTLTDEDYEQLKSHFGTTTNFNVAGYMLKDGKMLDFSGKHWGNPVADTRDVDHRDVWDAWENPDFDGTDEMVNMIANGNIRLMPETGGINLAVAPTADQRKMLEKYINHFRGEIVVDIDRVGGDTEETFTYDRGTSAKKIFDDIDNYFRGGRQSDLMRFHTKYEEAREFSDYGIRYSLREEAPPKTTGKAYKVFLLKNGQLYPPMVANPNGEGTPVGVWLNADAAPRAADSKTGRPQVQAGGKGTNTGKMTLAYRPGWHLGDVPQATQFAKLNPETGVKELFPSNFVWAECEYAMDVDYQEEAMSYGYNKNGKFQHSLAGLPKLPKDGYYRYRTNPNPDTVPWVITGAMKVNRILVDDETDAICRANGVEPLKRQGGALTAEKLAEMGLTKLDYEQHSDREAFVKDIDSWNREGRADGETFVLGSTGDVLQGLGAIESDIYMKSDKINTILADHKEITLEEIKKIPSILENPIMILASKNLGRSSKANSRIILFGSVKAKDGRPMLSVLDLRPVEKHLVIDDMQKVASVYTKDSNPVEFVRSSNVMYMDNKKTTSLLRTIGFQTPIELNESGFIGSISYRQQNVKLDGKPFSAVVNENTVQFSDRDNVSVYEAVGEDGRLASENAKLREDIAKLKSAISNEEISIRRFRSLADYLKKLAGSQYNRETLGDELKEIYTFIQTADNLQWNDVMAKVYDVANRMMNIKEGVTPNYFKRVLQDIRIDRVSLSAAQKGEVVNRFGNYSDFHKMMFGRINVVNEGTPLNEMWKTWSQKYPSIFDANLSETEQIKALVDIVDALKTTSSVMGEYEREEAIRHIATEVYNQFWNIASDSSEEVKKLRASHRSLMEELRTAYAERQKQNTLHPTGETALKYEQLLRKVKEKDAKEMARIKELSKARMDNYKDRLARNTKIQSITKKALTLNQWLVKNSKDEHVPEVMKEPVAYLLSAIDFSSKQLLGMRGGDKAYSPTKKDISLSKALEKVHAMVQKINSVQIGEDEITEIYGSFADFPMGFADDVSTLSGTVNDIMRRVGDNAYTLNEMSLEQLEELDNIVSIIKATVSKMNKFLAIRHAEGVAHLSQQSIDYMDSLGKGKVYDKILGKVDKTLQWGNALPYYTFKRFGEGGKMVYEAMQDGWDKFAFHVKDIIDYAENTYTSKEVKEWEEDIKEIDVLEPATDEEKSKRGYTPKYQTIQMSVPQIMSLYCLQKREQAKGHLLGGGIRVTDITTKKGVISQTEGAILSESEIDDIISRLTPRQREVADALQKFMNTTCAEWGNEVSMLRFGIKQFGEENYFPIQSDKNNLAVNDETEQNNSLFRLLNMSFTKGLTDKANNRVVISDIFDVFAQHASDMAKYNAMALPVLDAFKWYNYKEKVQKGETQFKTKSLKQSLENAFGKDGQNYFVTFLRDINGEKNVGRDTLSNGFFTNAKVASVGFNLKVVALQPTSYLRANAVIDTKYLTQALAHKPKVDMAEKYCGIALWKSLGFYDINVQRGVAELIKHEETLKDKAVEASMKGAEIADKITWGYLWNACEAEIRDTRKDLKVGSEEYYSVVGKRLREIIYTTQVVDSTMTRSQMMRSSDGGDKMLTAFASEPTLAYNMLQDCYYDWKLTERQTGSKSAAFRKTGRKMVRVYAAYTSTNLVASLIETIFQAYRDDDDEEEFLNHVLVFLENFGSNMGITTKIPYVKDLISIVQGFTSNRTDTQWVQNLVYAGKGWMKILNGEGNAYKTMYRTLQAISQVGGVPGSNLLREVVSLWNNTIGEIYPSLKIK